MIPDLAGNRDNKETPIVTGIKYAARLNAFKLGTEEYWPDRNRISTIGLLERAATAGLTAADLNYPDHLDGVENNEIQDALGNLDMHLNGLAMRYYTDPGFRLGAFTHPDAAVRQAAIDITLQGIDAAAELGCDLMTLWMGQDGFDYSFQADYRAMWDHTIEALEAVATHNRTIKIAIEYKPNEPRAFALMPDLATTLLAIKEAEAPNLGVTLDFAHVLYADEMPAHAAALVNRHSRLLGVHLNDGYGKRDDGLMVGSVHPVQTVELLVELIRCGYDRAIYFDTFPDHSGLDPVEEARTNIAAMDHLWAAAHRLADDRDLQEAIARQDAPASQRIVQARLFKTS